MTRSIEEALVSEDPFDDRSPSVPMEGGPAGLRASEGIPLVRRALEQIDLQETPLTHENCGQAGQIAVDPLCANHVPTLG